MIEKYDKSYKAILTQVLAGDFDRDLMEQAMQLTGGNESKAEALYIVRVCKGIWKPRYITIVSNKK